MYALPAYVLALCPAARPWVARLRTLLLTAVLGLWWGMALPSRPYDEENLARPRNAHLVAQIDGALAALGIVLPRETIRRALIDVTEPVIGLRNALVAPWEPLFGFAHMGQRWGLFLENGRIAFRLQIEGQRGERGWTLLYRHHQRDPYALSRWLGFRRLRGIHNPGSNGARAQYEGFVTWIAHKIFAEHPEFAAVRVSMERLRVGTDREPTRVLAIEHSRVRTQVDARAEARQPTEPS